MERVTAAGRRLRRYLRYRAHQNGVGFLWALLCVALISIYLLEVGTMWSTRSQRLREEELLRNGAAIRSAIEAYVKAETNGAFPKSFTDLLSDPRVSFARRYLREAYPDPMTNGDWQLVQGPQGELYGVYSNAPGEPLKQDDFPDAYASFALQKSYADWKFVYYPSSGMIRR